MSLMERIRLPQVEFFPILRPGMDRLALQREDAEDALMDPSVR